MPQDFWSNAIYSVTPTILFGLLFWFVIRAIVRVDRNERKVYARIEAEERAKLASDSPRAPREPATEGSTPAELTREA